MLMASNILVDAMPDPIAQNRDLPAGPVDPPFTPSPQFSMQALSDG
jgi:hypothetical protein